MASYWFFAATVLALAGVLYGSLVPGHLRPRSGLDGHIEHILAYLVLGLVLMAFVESYAMLTVMLVLLLILAAVMELLQKWIPGRSCRLTHFLASCAGGGAAVIIGAGKLVFSA
jgi:VanZ family protein